jgi:hypothetical protein
MARNSFAESSTRMNPVWVGMSVIFLSSCDSFRCFSSRPQLPRNQEGTQLAISKWIGGKAVSVLDRAQVVMLFAEGSAFCRKRGVGIMG